ncbi:RNA polymerase factor sigma-54 [Cereibacter sp. SYSU M97828]|nr:RNA polymerase factor sigma-54 [Cereibacter flavus]
MKSRQRIGITQGQRLQLNLGLTASIRVLELDAPELARWLEEQAAANPALQVGPPPDPGPGEWLPRWSNAFRQMGGGVEADLAESAAPSLMAHVMQEIARIIGQGRDYRLAVALAEALEPSGWLGQPLDQIALAAGCAESDVAAVLARLQQIEPRGLFARSLAECLRLQAEEEGCLDPVMDFMLAHLDLVAGGAIERIAALCGADASDIRARIRVLRQFDPKPGAQFVPGAAPTREPDLIARRGANGWDVSLNRSCLPTLAIAAPEGDDARDQVKQARALARMVEGRNTTMLNVGRAILMRQRAALEHGLAALVPMTMASVAADLSMHESTVSRVVAGTSVDTPLGTIWLRRLFTGRLGDTHSPAAAEVRAMLSRLIAAEDPAAPLSDAGLAEALAAHHLPVARRTLAKYRAMLNIPPANRRRRR